MKLYEKLGVPKNIIESAEILKKAFYDGLYDILGEELKESEDENENAYTINDPIEIDINGVSITIQLVVNFNKIPNRHSYNIKEDVLFYSAYSNVPKKPSVNNKKNDVIIKKIDTDNNISWIGLNFVTIYDNISEKLIKKLENINILSIIAHELKHTYYDNKKTTYNLKNHTEYKAIQNIDLGKDVGNFFHLLYTVNVIETVVFSSELYADMLDNNITKENFKEFMENSKLVENIKSAKNFNLQKLMSDIRNKEDEYVEILQEFIKMGYEASHDDIALNMLELSYFLLTHESSSLMKKFTQKVINDLNEIDNILSDFINKSFGAEINITQHQIGKNFNKKINKYEYYSNNILKYFEKLEKRLNFVGNKIYKKLYKLYDMLPETENTKIGNWDLHTKINSLKKENIDFVLKYDKFKTLDIKKNKGK
jgi:hypothetical protein